jgi:hypothetical protein
MTDRDLDELLKICDVSVIYHDDDSGDFYERIA